MKHSPLDERVAIAQKIADAWNKADIHYAVAHGLEKYPLEIGRDLDVFVSSRDMEHAFTIAIGILHQDGWTSIRARTPYRLNIIYAFKGGINLQIDLFPGLYWRGVPLIRCLRRDTQIGPFYVDNWAHFTKAILIKILARDLPGGFDSDVLEDPCVVEKCNQIVGSLLTSHILLALREQDQNAIRRISAALRRTLFRRQLIFKPWRFVNIVPLLATRIRRFFMSVAPVIALVGPDGVGKSTTLDILSQNNSLPFLGTVVKHWRPGLLPRLGVFRGESNTEQTGPVLPNRVPGRGHWLRLIYYWIDFAFGHFLLDNPVASIPKLILYDRCALDMAIDPIRYRFSSAKGIKLFWKLIPKPDLVILLYDTPERIAARKAELSKEEIEHQLKQWLELAAAGEIDAVIHTDTTPEEVARRINDLIICAFIRKNGGNLAVREESKDG